MREEKGRPEVGSRSGSFLILSSTGSIPSCSASSSMAVSSAKVPTASPGARMKVLASMSIVATRTPSRMVSAA